MKISKTREVTTPKRGTSRSAGLDFYVPAKNVSFVEDLFNANEEKIRPFFENDDSGGYFEDIIMTSLYHETLSSNEVTYMIGFQILPHQNIQIPSGIKVNIKTVKGFDFTSHNGLMLEAANKSSISKFKHLDVGATIVDEDYQGELHLSLTNTSSKIQTILFDEKIAQFILIPIVIDDVEIVEDHLLHPEKTERGEGCFGSTSNEIHQNNDLPQKIITASVYGKTDVEDQFEKSELIPKIETAHQEIQNTYVKSLNAICAVDQNFAMGYNDELLSKDDLKHFKTTTFGHTVVSGRKTFDAMGRRALPNRINIIITRNPELQTSVDNVTFMNLDQLHSYCMAKTDKDNKESIWFIGGSEFLEVVFSMFTISRFFLTIFNFSAEKADVWLGPIAKQYCKTALNCNVDTYDSYVVKRMHNIR